MNNLHAIQSPDYITCDRAYAGTQGDLKLSECMQAAGRLPVGSTEVTYQDHLPYGLPTVLESGQCQVQVDRLERFSFVGPDLPFMAKPDLFRDLAAEVIRQCVIPRGHGGFATLGMQNLMDWATNSATSLGELLEEHIPQTLEAFTVNVFGKAVGDEAAYPGETDPSIAYSLAYALDQAGQKQADGSNLKAHYERAAAVLEERGDEMERLGHITWQQYKASPPISQRHMVYECDSKLGVPMSADCSQLAYSELGPPSDTITIGPNAAKFLSSKTCNVAITASINLALTWHQIKAALGTLIDTCVMHPLLPARGGRAYAGRQSIKQRLGSSVIGRRRNTVTGLNALSPHVNITLFQQAEPVPATLADELKTCTWEQVKKGGNIKTCVRDPGPPIGG
ncbi:MAG: hypothetical protein Q9187_006379 [Circinaria calcarea]